MDAIEEKGNRNRNSVSEGVCVDSGMMEIWPKKSCQRYQKHWHWHRLLFVASASGYVSII